MTEALRTYAKSHLRFICPSNGTAEASRVLVRRIPPRTLSDYSRPLARPGESTDLSVQRPKQIGLTAGRRMAVPLAIQGKQRPAPRRSLAYRPSPYSAARLRRGG